MVIVRPMLAQSHCEMCCTVGCVSVNIISVLFTLSRNGKIQLLIKIRCVQTHMDVKKKH